MSNEVWTNQVRHVRDGEPVDARTTGRPDRDLELRDNYLRARIDSAELGEGLYARDVTVESGLLVGQPAFFNDLTQKFERALAGVETDTATGSLVARKSAACIGILHTKQNATKGDILLAGRGAVSLSNSVDGAAVAGSYYLSGVTPGKLSRQRPPVAVPVLFYDGTNAYVLPALKDFLREHVHHRVELVCRPAGTDSISSGSHSITSPDADLPGWLPAGHASFSDTAPAGAAFGYNLAAHPELDRIWPPIPPENAGVVWDKGHGHVGGTSVASGRDGVCVVDRNGIWWFSDCVGDVPWPADGSGSSDVGSNSSDQAECPRLEEMRLTIYYTEMLFATADAVVNSLAPADGSPIVITDCDGNPASTGALQIALDLSFLLDDDLVDGGVVFKELDGQTFKRGWVAEGLKAGANVTLTSTHSEGSGADEVHQGVVTVDVDANLADRELGPQIARLDDVKERYSDALGVPYLGFVNGKAAHVRLRYDVPSAGLPASPTFRVRALVYGSTAGTLPVLTMTVKKLPRPSGSPLTLSTPTEGSLSFPSGVAVGAGQYAEVLSAALSVTAGDTVLVSLRRAASDGYAGEVGLIRLGGIIGS